MDTDDPQPDPETEGTSEPPSSPVPAEDSPLHGLFRAFRLFLIPFLLSWALAYIGSARDVDWVYFTGLGGVTLSMLVLLVWLIS